MTTMNNTIKFCPYCSGTQFITGRQDGYGAVVPAGALSLKSQKLYHVICLNCGSVVRSYVENPSKLV
jgi:predicted nucleic-acid-binding Zn-ribbon protein